MNMAKKNFTDKQNLFCKYYIIDFHVTKAAEKAGYSKKTAYSIGSELLKKPEIQDRLKELMKKREERTEITADRVVKELAKFAFNEDGKSDAFKVDSKDKIKALELLAKHTGAFNKDESEKTNVHIEISKWLENN